jgi:hypothetical protein
LDAVWGHYPIHESIPIGGGVDDALPSPSMSFFDDLEVENLVEGQDEVAADPQGEDEDEVLPLDEDEEAKAPDEEVAEEQEADEESVLSQLSDDELELHTPMNNNLFDTGGPSTEMCNLEQSDGNSVMTLKGLKRLLEDIGAGGNFNGKRMKTSETLSD